MKVRSRTLRSCKLQAGNTLATVDEYGVFEVPDEIGQGLITGIPHEYHAVRESSPVVIAESEIKPAADDVSVKNEQSAPGSQSGTAKRRRR